MFKQVRLKAWQWMGVRLQGHVRVRHAIVSWELNSIQWIPNEEQWKIQVIEARTLPAAKICLCQAYGEGVS